MSKRMSERGNVSIELVFGFSVFVSLLIPAVVEFSEISKASLRLQNYLAVLGRSWSTSDLGEAETTLLSMQSALSRGDEFAMEYECEPGCTVPEARLTIRLSQRINSLLLPNIKVKGSFARDYYSQ